MNVLVRLLADTGASLIGARPEPDSGRQAENGAFRSLLERMGLSAPAGSDGAPGTATTSAGEEDAETPSDERKDDTPAVASKRIVAFPASLGHVDGKERNRNSTAQSANDNPAAAVPPPAA